MQKFAMSNISTIYLKNDCHDDKRRSSIRIGTIFQRNLLDFVCVAIIIQFKFLRMQEISFQRHSGQLGRSNAKISANSNLEQRSCQCVQNTPFIQDFAELGSRLSADFISEWRCVRSWRFSSK